MRYSVGSIEDGIARLENDNNEEIFVNVCLLSKEIREGDILDFDGEEYVINQQATVDRRRSIYEKFKKIIK